MEIVYPTRKNSTKTDPGKGEINPDTPRPVEDTKPSALPVNVTTTPLSVPAVGPERAIPDRATTRRLIAFAKPQWRLLALGGVSIVASTGVNMLWPWGIGQILDYAQSTVEGKLLFGLPYEQAAALSVAVLLLGVAANSARMIALKLAGQRTSAAIRCVLAFSLRPKWKELI